MVIHWFLECWKRNPVQTLQINLDIKTSTLRQKKSNAMQNSREINLIHLSLGSKRTAVLCTTWGLCTGLSWKRQTCSCWNCYSVDAVRNIWTKIFLFLFAVKILAWVLGDLCPIPDLPQNVGKRVSKSLNYPVPYFPSLQTVSNILLLCSLSALCGQSAGNARRCNHLLGICLVWFT